jgi:hypothetical protein
MLMSSQASASALPAGSHRCGRGASRIDVVAPNHAALRRALPRRRRSTRIVRRAVSGAREAPYYNRAAFIGGYPRVVDCPNCRAPMTSRALPGHGGLAATIEVDGCSACTVFWFDTMESVRLMPAAVLELFRLVGATGAARNVLASTQRCVRCSATLSFTHDLQRATRFTYWRCPRGHGRLITFHQFLAEKNFLRPPSAAELARLRGTIRQVSCSQCGAPIDLRSDSACRHCGAPVTLIDTESVARSLRELSSPAGASADQGARNVGTTLSDAQIDALFELERSRDRTPQRDLLTVGAAALAATIGGWLAAG